jgi:hypothetical protein
MRKDLTIGSFEGALFTAAVVLFLMYAFQQWGPTASIANGVIPETLG